jgi:sulfate transport system permease protein
MSARRPPWGRLGALLGYVAVFIALPVLALGVAALRDPAAWLRALVAPEAVSAIVLTVVITLAAALIGVIAGTAGGLVLVRAPLPGRRLLDAVVDLPLALSPVMIGLAFLLLVGRGGTLRPLLDAVGLEIAFAPLGVLVGTLFVTLPFTVREVAVVLEAIGTSEEEAAATLGARPGQIFWLVTLPNLRHALLGGALLTVARSLGEFGAVLVLGGAIAGRTSTATTHIHLAIESRDMPGAIGVSVLLAAASIAVVGLLRRPGSH